METRIDLDVTRRACRAIHPRRDGVCTRSKRNLHQARCASVLPAAWGSTPETRRQPHLALSRFGPLGGYAGVEEAAAPSSVALRSPASWAYAALPNFSYTRSESCQ